MESIIWFENMLSSADPQQPLLSPTEEIIFEDSFANEIYMKFIDDESSSDRIDLFSEETDHEKSMLIDEFQYVNTKEDINPSDINDFIITPVELDEDVKTNNVYQAENNYQFVEEFKSLLESVSNEITPPQTPPPEIFRLPSPIYQQENIPGFEIYELQQEASQSFSTSSSYYDGSNQSECDAIFDPESIISSPADIQRELEVVDELVRAHSRNASDIEDNKSSIYALSVSSAWSPRSGYASSSSGCSQYGDDEPKFNKSGRVTKRPRPYRRNPEEKKFRKKEQNKNAATRYRQKKKQEIEIIMDEGKILEERHRKLMAIYKDSRREVKYLKSLLRDLFKARGFI